MMIVLLKNASDDSSGTFDINRCLRTLNDMKLDVKRHNY